MLKCDKCKKKINNFKELSPIEWYTFDIKGETGIGPGFYDTSVALSWGINFYHTKCLPVKKFSLVPHPVNKSRVLKELLMAIILRAFFFLFIGYAIIIFDMYKLDFIKKIIEYSQSLIALFIIPYLLLLLLLVSLFKYFTRYKNYKQFLKKFSN
ncbi:MAG: hypothetical protein ABIG10_00280 [bacterium]